MLNEKEKELDSKELDVTISETEKITENKEVKLNFDDLSLEELVEKQEEIINTSKPYSVSKQIDELKISFYKKLHDLHLKEENKTEEEVVEEKINPLHPLEIKFKSGNNKFRKLKADYRKNREVEEQKNCIIKKKIIEDIDELSKQEESIKTTFEKLGELQKKWRVTGNVPLSENNNLWQSYHHHVELFYDYIKINKDLRDLDFKRNLEEKTRICEKSEALLSEKSINKMFDSLQELHEHWKNVGPVEREKREEIWERFQISTKKINKKRNEHFLKKKDMFKNNLHKKNEICKKINKLSLGESNTHTDWQNRIKKLQILMSDWKSSSPIDKKDNKIAWSTYRESINIFNQNKNDFYKNRKDEHSNNLQVKVDIAKKAENLQNSTDWENSSKQFIKLQDDWKKTTFVPNNLSSDVWKSFRKSCDTFFNARKKHYKEINKQRDKNLIAKNSLLKYVKKFKITEDSKKDIIQLKEFSVKWNSLGHIPIKLIKINDEFSNVISSFYKKLKVDNSEKEKIQFQLKVDSLKGNLKQLNSEKDFIRKKIDQIHKSMLQYENNISFFGNGKGTEVLKNEVEKKIENSKLEIENLKKKLTLINKI